MVGWRAECKKRALSFTPCLIYVFTSSELWFTLVSSVLFFCHGIVHLLLNFISWDLKTAPHNLVKLSLNFASMFPPPFTQRSEVPSTYQLL